MSFEVTRLLGTKTSISVPRDQQRILDKHGTGAVRPDNYPVGPDDIPPRVLSSLVAAHSNKRKRDAGGGSGTSTGSTGSTGSHVRGKRPNNGPGPPESVDSDTGSDDSDDRPSREPSAQRSKSRTPTAASHTTHQTPASRTNPTPNSRPPSKPPRLAPVIHFPSSVEEPDDEMDDQPRKDVPPAPGSADANSTMSPVKTPRARPPTTAAIETPPCGQPSQNVVIPGTEARAAPPPIEDKDRRRSKRMKPIEFSDPMDVDVSRAPTLPRMAPVHNTTYRAPDSSNEATTSSSSSGIVPSSQPQPPPQHTPAPPKNNIPFPPQQQQQQQQQQRVVSQTPVRSNQTSVLPSSTSAQHHVFATPSHAQQHYQQPPTQPQWATPAALENDTPDLEPFELYVATYPDYVIRHAGSLALFVKACVCLSHMARRRSLHHYLWDDFIRAFSSGYLDYVRATPRPLVASDWYNDADDAPLYTDHVVGKHNLDAILHLYAREVAKARRHLVVDDDADHASRRRSAPATTHEQPTPAPAPVPVPASLPPPAPTYHHSSPAAAPPRQPQGDVPLMAAAAAATERLRSLQTTPRAPLSPAPGSGSSAPSPLLGSSRADVRDGNAYADSPPAGDDSASSRFVIDSTSNANSGRDTPGSAPVNGHSNGHSRTGSNANSNSNANTPAAATPTPAGFRVPSSTNLSRPPPFSAAPTPTPAAAAAPPPSTAGSVSGSRAAKGYFKNLGRRRSVKEQERVNAILRQKMMERRSTIS